MASRRSTSLEQPGKSTPVAAAFDEHGPRAGVPGRLSDAIGRSPRAAAQRATSSQIQASPYMTAQRAQLSSAFGAPAQREAAPQEEQLLTKAASMQAQARVKPALVAKGVPVDDIASERSRSAHPAVQRYALGDLKDVKPLDLSPNQKKLYNRLDLYQREVEYIQSLNAKAEEIAVDNPKLAREIRARRHTVRNELTSLAKYVDAIPGNILDMTGGEDLRKVEAAAATHVEQISAKLVEIQAAVAMTGVSTRTFDEFMGDAKRIGEYKTGDSKAQAIPVVWYKRKQDYKDIVLTKPDENGEKKFQYPNGPTVKLAGDEYDLTAKDADPFQVGDTFENKHLFTDRGVQQKIRLALIEYGFDHKGLDGDHIQDLGFGGVDEEDNVWPLDEKINRRPFNGWRHLYGVNVRKSNGDGVTKTIASLPNKWFKIKDHLAAGDGAVPDEGIRPSTDSGTDD